MKFGHLIVAILFSLFFLSACQEELSQSERILFSSSRSGNSDIYLMDTSGVNVRPVVATPDEEWAAVWVNENEISFLRQTGPTRILPIRYNLQTKEEIILSHPYRCLLDDKNMIFHPVTGNAVYACHGEVYAYFPEKDATTHYTLNINGNCQYVSWGSDTTIIFTNDITGNNEVYSLNINSLLIQNLTNHPSNDLWGSISPDGQYFAFSSDRVDEYYFNIHLVNLVTNQIDVLTPLNGSYLISRWSPDGQRLYIGGGVDGNWDIYVYDMNSETFNRITEDASFDGDPQIW